MTEEERREIAEDEYEEEDEDENETWRSTHSASERVLQLFSENPPLVAHLSPTDVEDVLADLEEEMSTMTGADLTDDDLTVFMVAMREKYHHIPVCSGADIGLRPNENLGNIIDILRRYLWSEIAPSYHLDHSTSHRLRTDISLLSSNSKTNVAVEIKRKKTSDLKGSPRKMIDMVKHIEQRGELAELYTLPDQTTSRYQRAGIRPRGIHRAGCRRVKQALHDASEAAHGIFAFVSMEQVFTDSHSHMSTGPLHYFAHLPFYPSSETA